MIYREKKKKKHNHHKKINHLQSPFYFFFFFFFDCLQKFFSNLRKAIEVPSILRGTRFATSKCIL